MIPKIVQFPGYPTLQRLQSVTEVQKSWEVGGMAVHLAGGKRIETTLAGLRPWGPSPKSALANAVLDGVRPWREIEPQGVVNVGERLALLRNASISGSEGPKMIRLATDGLGTTRGFERSLSLEERVYFLQNLPDGGTWGSISSAFTITPSASLPSLLSWLPEPVRVPLQGLVQAARTQFATAEANVTVNSVRTTDGVLGHSVTVYGGDPKPFQVRAVLDRQGAFMGRVVGSLADLAAH